MGGRAAMVNAKPNLGVKLGKLDLAVSDADGQRLLRLGRGVRAVRRSYRSSAASCSRASRGCRASAIRRRVSCIRPAGLLNAIGLQNPGIDWYLEREVAKFAARPCAVIGSVAGFSIDDYAYVCEKLAARDEIAAIEINISCPNVASEGETFACDPKLTAKVVERGARDDR